MAGLKSLFQKNFDKKLTCFRKLPLDIVVARKNNPGDKVENNFAGQLRKRSAEINRREECLFLGGF